MKCHLTVWTLGLALVTTAWGQPIISGIRSDTLVSLADEPDLKIAQGSAFLIWGTNLGVPASSTQFPLVRNL